MRPVPTRNSLNAVAVPIVGEFLLGIVVAVAGLSMAASISDAAAGSFGLTQIVLESLAVLFRVLAIGVGVVVGQTLGGGRQHEVQKPAFAVLSASTWVGLSVSLLLLLGHDALLRLLNAPAEVLPLAGTLMVWMAPAMLIEAHNLSMSAVLRAHLFAKESLRIMLTMHATHLLLAWVLMKGVGGMPGLGLEGYAVAYGLSRALALFLHVRFWRMRLGLRPQASHWFIAGWVNLLPVLRVGIPGAFVEFGYRLAFMVSIAATAKLGVVALATHAYTLQTLKLVMIVSMSIGWAVEIMVGRLVGAGRLREANALVLKSVRSGLLASGLLVLIAAATAPWTMRLFTQDPAIIEMVQHLLFVSVALELSRAFNMIINGALRASGDVYYPAMVSVLSFVLCLAVGSHVLSLWWGITGIWLAYIADEWVRGFLVWRRWRTGGWWSSARASARHVRHR